MAEPGHGTVRLKIYMKIRSLPSMGTVALAIVLTLPACRADQSGGTTTTGSSSITTTTAAPTTTTATTGPAGGPGCPGDSEPIEDGVLLNVSEAASDAEQISAINWESNENCEVFTIEFTTDQSAPATTPPSVEAEFFREVGVLRVSIGVEVTAITDQLAETALVRQVFVPRSDDRTLFVDLHLSAPALATVVTNSSPAQVVIFLAPGGSDYPSTPAIAQNVVLISPVEGPVESPVVVNGYSRNQEANTIGRIVQGSDVLAEGFTTAADWSETWGEFTLTLDPTGSGAADLFVGEQSAQDGSDRGVVIPIDVP